MVIVDRPQKYPKPIIKEFLLPNDLAFSHPFTLFTRQTQTDTFYPADPAGQKGDRFASEDARGGTDRYEFNRNPQKLFELCS